MPDSVREERRRFRNVAVPIIDNCKPRFLKRQTNGDGKTPQFPEQTEKLFLTIARHTGDVVIIVDRQGRILYINGTGSRLAGKNALGNNAFVLLQPASQEQCMQTLDKSIATDKSAVFEHPGPDSTWWLTRFIPVKEFGGPIPAAVIICSDITMRKRMEEQLNRVNRALMVVGRCNEILVRSIDERRFLKDTCKAIIRTRGYSLVWVGLAEYDEFKTVRPIAHAGFEDGYLETVNITWADTERGQGPTGTAIRTGRPQVMRDIVDDPNYAPWREEALRRGYSSSAALPMISEGQVIGALNVYSDQSDAFGPKEVKLLLELASDLAYGMAALQNRAERDRLSRELHIHENKLIALGMELTLAEERERRRIADGVHDELSQKLVMAKFDLQKLRHQVQTPDVCGSLSLLCERMDEMLEDTRSLTFELSSPLLYAFGLSSAVEAWLEEQVCKKHGLNYEFVSNLTPLCLEVEIRVTLYQVVRELLTNIIKHAKAANVKVSMQKTDGNVSVVVEDDGIGFNTAEMLEPSKTSLASGFGLFSVRERIEYLGGSFAICSEPGKGTRVTITVAQKHDAGSIARAGSVRIRS